MKRTLLASLLAPLLIGAVHTTKAADIFREDFSSYAEGTRPTEGWTWAAPGANINEQAVRATTNAFGETVNALRIHHDFDGAGGEDSKKFGGFVAQIGEEISDEAIIFTTRVRFNEKLGSQDLGFSLLTAAGQIGPYIRFIDDARVLQTELQGIAVYNGSNPLPLISGIRYGDWYEIRITTVPSSGRYSIRIRNLNTSEAGQSGSYTDLRFFGTVGPLNRISLGRAGTFPQVDMDFEMLAVEDTVIFGEDFESYAEGMRPEEGWVFSAPGANIADQNVRETVNAAGEATKALRILHDYDGAGGENSRNFGGFTAELGQEISSEPIIFSTRVRFNEELGSQDVALSLLSASSQIGPYIRFIDGGSGDLVSGIAVNHGTVSSLLVSPLLFGTWYELTIRTVPDTGTYSIEIVNLESEEEGQSGSQSGLAYFAGTPLSFNRISLGRARTFPQVDMFFDEFRVTYDLSPPSTEPVNLTVDVRGQGAVLRDPDLEIYQPGSDVILTAVPAAGYVFLNWGGEATGTQNPLTLTMNSDREVVATFIERALAESDYLVWETFESYEPGTAPTHPGDRTLAHWVFSSPTPDTEVTVVESSSTDGLGDNGKTMRLFRPTSVGASIELAARRTFEVVRDQELEFSMKVKYNQDLADTTQGIFLRDSASGSTTFGPYLVARPDGYASNSWQLSLPEGATDVMITRMQVGAWYRVDIRTTPSTGLYDISITNLDSPEDPSQNASRTDVPFFHNITKIDTVQISRTGQSFVVDAEYDDITVYLEGSGMDLPPEESGYADWKITHFGAVDHPDAGDLEDPDGDGAPNLIEYALGGNPTIASRSSLPVTEIAENRLALVFSRLNPADVGYSVEAAGELGDWTPIATLAAGATVWSGAAADALLVSEAEGKVTVRDIVEIGDGARRFLRLRIVAP